MSKKASISAIFITFSGMTLSEIKPTTPCSREGHEGLETIFAEDVLPMIKNFHILFRFSPDVASKCAVRPGIDFV